MDASVISKLLMGADTPMLPNTTAMRWAMHGGWAIVLGSGMMLVSRKRAIAYRWYLSLLVVLWTLLPLTASPAHWLGLAFQSPSLTSVVICVGWLVHCSRRLQGSRVWPVQIDRRALKILLVLGITAGWLMLLDTMAMLPLPFSLYALGFGSSAFTIMLAIAALLWVALGSLASALPLAVLSLFAISRLPTGNVWDALLDPWLWLALQTGWLLSVVRRLWTARRLSAAT